MTNLDSILHFIWEALTAIGTISVAILAIWGDWFRSKFASPKLRLVVGDIEGDIRSVNPLGESPIGNPVRAIYFCLQAENRRPWVTVHNCKVFLRAVHRCVPNGQFYREPLTVPLQYLWPPGSYTVSDVQNIRRDAVLDFGKIVEKGDKFEPTLYEGNNNLNVFVRAKEVVRYSLQIVADNFTSQKFQVFEVTWNGYSDSVEGVRSRQKMEKILKIREVTQDELKQTAYVT